MLVAILSLVWHGWRVDTSGGGLVVKKGGRVLVEVEPDYLGGWGLVDVNRDGSKELVVIRLEFVEAMSQSYVSIYSPDGKLAYESPFEMADWVPEIKGDRLIYRIPPRGLGSDMTIWCQDTMVELSGLIEILDYGYFPCAFVLKGDSLVPAPSLSQDEIREAIRTMKDFFASPDQNAHLYFGFALLSAGELLGDQSLVDYVAQRDPKLVELYRSCR